MGQVLRIEHDEAAGLAREWESLTGESVGPLVAQTLRSHLDAERLRREWVAEMMRVTDAFAELIEHPLPGSDHSWLYDDETGLPI